MRMRTSRNWYRLRAAICVLVVCACSPTIPRRVVTPRVPVQSLQGFGAEIARIVPGLDGNDLRRAAEAQAVSLEHGRPGQPTPWRNPDTGNYGEVIPGPGNLPAQAGNCRNLRHTIYVRGRAQTFSLDACRDVQGIWARRSA